MAQEAQRRTRLPAGRQTLTRIALALAIGTGGGVLFAWLGLPLPWMLGALMANLAGSLCGLPLAVPEPLRRPMIAVLGIMLGSAFTIQRLADAAPWLASLAALPIYVLTVGTLVFLYLRRVSGFDTTTTFFAAAPGGLSEMIAISDQMGGDMRHVSLVHSTRLLFIVVTIPFLAQLLGVDTSAVRPSATEVEIAVEDLALLAALGAAGYALGTWLRLPAASFLGPLVGSAVAHLAGWIETEPPFVLMAIAQVVIGSSVGARFVGVPLAVIGRAMLIGFGATLIMLVVTLVFAAVLHRVTGHPLGLLLLAFIPGGFPEMSLIGLAMGADPAFIVTHHAFRVFLVVVIALPVFSLLRRSGRFGLGAGTSKPGGET